MNKTAHSWSVSNKPTTVSGSRWYDYIEFAKTHKIDALDVAQSGRKVPVQEHSGSLGLGSHTVNIDDLIAELVTSPEDELEMQNARRQIGSFLEQENIGGGLRGLRLKEGLSQRALADLAGTTQPRIARLEQGIGDPQASTLDRLAAALNCSGEEVYSAWKQSRGTQHD